MRFAVHRSARRPASPHGHSPEPADDAEAGRAAPPAPESTGRAETAPARASGAGTGATRPLPASSSAPAPASGAKTTGPAVGTAGDATRPLPPTPAPMPPVRADTTTAGGGEPSSTGEDRRSVMRIGRRGGGRSDRGPAEGATRGTGGRSAAGTARRGGSRPGLIAIVLILWLIIAAIALTGTLIVAFSQEHPAKFPAPLKIYPVTQQLTGQQCPAGVQGIAGQSSIGPVCYELATGITIKRVNDIHVERAKAGGYAVSLSLTPADGRALKNLTRNAAGRAFALTVREQVVAAPRVDAPITKGRVLITGNLTRSAAEDIVARLKDGKAVPAPSPAPTWQPPAPTTQPTAPTTPPTGPSTTGPNPTTTSPNSSTTSPTQSATPGATTKTTASRTPLSV
ncbi:SecDF P1 head subdomain-containing protein [Actinoallomurus sp. CA-150999]|uniref:SecDF P1 head subdomain-containing protein n=1 Tax=Actinoallomurus sp. CA-150999 TaxID=3239887 RepID=UPI003D924FB2